MEPIILASGSRRRQDFFKMLGLPFSILPAVIDESSITQANPLKLTVELAVKKVEKVIEIMKDQLPRWICGADTIIAVDNKIFGKPKSREEAAEMLKKLSGKQHKVITSIALYNGINKEIDHCSANCSVAFAPLSDAEIDWYLNTNEWQGAAGAYHVEGLAACFITKIKGTPSTVAGLPLREFYAMLRVNGYPYGALL
jgi:septum formation protein